MMVSIPVSTRQPATAPRLSAGPWLRTIFTLALVLSAIAANGAISAETPAATKRFPGEQEGAATILRRAEVLRDRSTNAVDPARPVTRLWPLVATPDARMSYYEVAGRTGMHFHPDADHRLYVLEGSVVIVAGTNTSVAHPGDLVVIPRGVRHCYDVPAPGAHALLLTFDAPPYDPRMTVQIPSTSAPRSVTPSNP